MRAPKVSAEEGQMSCLSLYHYRVNVINMRLYRPTPYLILSLISRARTPLVRKENFTLTTLIQDLEMRQAKIGQAIKLLREAGLEGYQNGGELDVMAGEAERDATRKKWREAGPKTKETIEDKTRERWAEIEGVASADESQSGPRKPLTLRNGDEGLQQSIPSTATASPEKFMWLRREMSEHS
jgi:hypothetical protein